MESWSFAALTTFPLFSHAYEHSHKLRNACLMRPSSPCGKSEPQLLSQGGKKSISASVENCLHFHIYVCTCAHILIDVFCSLVSSFLILITHYLLATRASAYVPPLTRSRLLYFDFCTTSHHSAPFDSHILIYSCYAISRLLFSSIQFTSLFSLPFKS